MTTHFLRPLASLLLLGFAPASLAAKSRVPSPTFHAAVHTNGKDSSFAATPETAQSISSAVRAAEAEGARFPRRAASVAVASAFSEPFEGTAERRCVEVSPKPMDRDPRGHPLRSGDFIVGSAFGGPEGPHVRQGLKIAWVPLHSPVASRSPLLVRAIRIGHAADTLRVNVRRWASTGRGSTTEGGYISVVRFPAAGTWLALATAGDDWGCFLLKVAPAAR